MISLISYVSPGVGACIDGLIPRQKAADVVHILFRDFSGIIPAVNEIFHLSTVTKFFPILFQNFGDDYGFTMHAV